jgi:hypothetical protein
MRRYWPAGLVSALCAAAGATFGSWPAPCYGVKCTFSTFEAAAAGADPRADPRELLRRLVERHRPPPAIRSGRAYPARRFRVFRMRSNERERVRHLAAVLVVVLHFVDVHSENARQLFERALPVNRFVADGLANGPVAKPARVDRYAGNHRALLRV